MPVEEHLVFQAKGRTNITTPRQQCLFDGIEVTPSLHVSMGYFYEIITSALFGGRCQTNIYRSDEGHEEGLIKPDVVTSGNVILESKANQTGHQLLLLDSQIERYRYLQSQHPYPKIYFFIFRHQFRKVKSFKGTESDLWAALAQKTTLGVALPFSVINRMHDHGKMGENNLLTMNYESFHYQCVRVRSPVVNSFYDNPVTALAGFNLDSENFRWSRWQIPKIKINGVKVNNFPILVMHDADHAAWSAEFNKTDEEVPDDCPF